MITIALSANHRGWMFFKSALLILFILLARRALCDAALLPEEGAATSAPAAAATKPSLAELSLDDLVKLEVTSVSKKPEKLSGASAAISVLTQDDIRRSGATTIADALRLVPGLNVGRVDAHTWAVSSRGFNDSFANKLLVLMDGRSVYTPLFSGVYWDVQNTFMEDIERVEIVRGPGATLWGANAVNGVLNLITRNANDSRGGIVTAGGGSEDLGFSSLRYGAKLSEHWAYRVYSQYESRDSSALENGRTADDRWQMSQMGFRADSDGANGVWMTLQGDAYAGRLNQTYNFPSLTGPGFRELLSSPLYVQGGNLLGRVKKEFSANSESTLQLYYDNTRRDARGFHEETRHTYDIDWQHHLGVGDRMDIVAGAGYRMSMDNIHGSFPVSFRPTRRSTQLFNSFAEDTISLVPDRLRLTLGVKLENNDYTGFEVQPGGRMAWTPHEQHTLWASVARAVRSPSRADEDIRLNDRVVAGAPPTVYSIFGTAGFRSEELIAYEIGYRYAPMERLSFDLALFLNDYEHLRTTEVRGTGTDPSLPGSPDLLILKLENRGRGETYGGELTTTWRPTDWWRWRAAYSYLQLQIHRAAGSTDRGLEDEEHKTPRNQLSLQSSMDLPWNLHFDAIGRYVDEVSDQNIPPYVALDLRLAWHPTRNLEFSIVGQNLLDDRHPEFRPTVVPIQRTEVQRSIYGKITFRF